jgi:putative tricarboxylic transport membrane protein
MEPNMLEMAVHALGLLLDPMRLLILMCGVFIGLAIGAIPGLGGIVGLAVLIPFTNHLDSYAAFALLLGMAAVVTSSDLIPAVLFGVPGTVGAAATVIDGNQMARKGLAGRAFGAGFAASLFGGLIGALLLAAAVPILRPLMLSIGSPELLAFSVFGLSTVATLSGRAPLKGLTAACLGLMIAMVGTGPQAGTLRWTFNWLYLWDGVNVVPITLGLFALPELADLAIRRTRIASQGAVDITLASQWEGVRDVYRHWWLVVRCSVIGTALGTVPGIGSAVIDWIVYGYAQRTESNPETFGSGDVRGVIAPESANNAKEAGHLVPTIAFGVPAGASMALLLSAFTMHGLVPGPEMLTKHLDLTYTIIWSLTLAHCLGAAICICGSRLLARLADVPYEILLPIIIPIVFIAAFQGTHSWGDLFSLLLFGVIGWTMKRLGWPRPPMVLGVVVGGIFERYLFVSTQLYGDQWLLRPIVILVGVMIAWTLFRPLQRALLDLWQQLRHLQVKNLRLHAPAAFTLLVIAVIVAAIVSSSDWPPVEQLVPRTACWAALIAASLNLITEIFGTEQPSETVAQTGQPAAAEYLAPAIVRLRAVEYFAWLGGFVALVGLIGFIPAIPLFIFVYMGLRFREPWLRAATCAAATGLFCWIVFDVGLAVPWPQTILESAYPALRFN